MTHEQEMLEATANELEEMVERIEEFEDWAEDVGYLAIKHKLMESKGRILSASDAARQYADGTLEPRH
jgi:hypothetical protein